MNVLAKPWFGGSMVIDELITQGHDMTTKAIIPANQTLRISILRLLFLLMLPLMLFSRSAWMEPGWMFEILEVMGLFFVIFAVLGRFWSILYIGGHKNRSIMQEGPYSICRHPLYLFSTIGVLGLGMMLGSIILTALLGVLTFVILSVTARKEEQFLRAEFGDSYQKYEQRVPRIWPDLSLFRTENYVEFSVAHLKGNFFDALVFLAFIPIAEIMEWVKEENLISTFLIY